MAAGANELLVKILIAHEGYGSAAQGGGGAPVEQDLAAAPVLESALAAISQVGSDNRPIPSDHYTLSYSLSSPTYSDYFLLIRNCSLRVFTAMERPTRRKRG